MITKKATHKARPKLRNEAVQVTVHLEEPLPSLRQERESACILRAIRASQNRFGCRIVAHSALSNHLHLVAEAENEEKLSQAMKGLQVRIARAPKAHARRGPRNARSPELKTGSGG
jgi:REP element-mobilizing transposase RayT